MDISLSYAISFGKCDGGDGAIDITVSDEEFKWINIISKLTEEVDDDEIKNAIDDIKEEIERIKALKPGEEYESGLYPIDDDAVITKEELLDVDWDSVDYESFTSRVTAEIYQYEEECYKELMEDEGELDDYEEEYDGEYPGTLTAIWW